MEKQKVFNYKRKIAFVLLFSMFLNTFTPFGVLLREGYAESSSDNIKSVELFDEYYPKNSFGKVENWIVNEWTGSGPGVEGGKLLKENGKLYVAKENGKKKGTYIVPIDNGLEFTFKPDESHTGPRRPSEAYLMSQKPFENDNLYEFTFNSKRTKGSEPRGISFRIITGITDKRHTVTLLDNNTKAPEKNDGWNTLNEGNLRVTFYGTGKRQAFGFSFTGKSSQEENTYEFTNLSLKNITPASKPVVNGDIQEGQKTLEGRAEILSDQDKRATYEGDQVLVTVNGKEYITSVDKNNQWKIELDEPLKLSDEVSVKIINPNSNMESSVEGLDVKYNPENHKPELDDVKEGEKKVTGTGVPGDEIIIEDKDGNKLGTGKVKEDGTFEIDLDEPLKQGQVITATPKTDGKEGSKSDDKMVDYNPEIHQPEIEEALEGEKKVTGTGIPGDKIIIEDKDGNELGDSIVKEDGTFEVDLDRPLDLGEEIIAIPETNGEEGKSSEKKIDYNSKYHKPEIDHAKSGEKKVEGTGIPGDKIIITDAEGNKLGDSIVKEDGTFEVDVNRPLKKGEEIKGYTKTGENESDDTNVKVTYEAENHKPKITEAKDNKKKVKGTGIPGDEIVITDEEGNELGIGTVDEDGNFEIDTNRPLIGGEEIEATPITGNNKGHSDSKKIEYNE